MMAGGSVHGDVPYWSFLMSDFDSGILGEVRSVSFASQYRTLLEIATRAQYGWSDRWISGTANGQS